VLYPDALLAAHKAERRMFRRVDTHWTDRGAFLVYRSLIEPLSNDIPMRLVSESDIFFTDQTVTGDLGSKLDPPRYESTEFAHIASSAAHAVYDNCVHGTGSVVITRCAPAPPTTCLLLGDSYSFALLKFLPETFRTFVFVQRPSLEPGLLERLRPDVVLSVIAERFLLRVPDDAQPISQRELEAHKRAQERVRPPRTLFGHGPAFVFPAQVEEIRARMLAAGGLRDATIVSVMAYATLSPADVMSLRWHSVSDGVIELETAGRTRRVPLWDTIADDLERWRAASGAGPDDPVFAHPDTEWGIREWGTWRAESYGPAVSAVGLRRLRPWSLHNTYVHLRLLEGADPAQVSAETGAATTAIAIARARAARAGEGAPGAVDASIRAARAAVETSGSTPAVS
jgi:integrase